MWSFVFPGAGGAVSYARRGSVNFSNVTRLILGVAPAALCGAVINGALPAAVVGLMLTVLMACTGVHTLATSGRHRPVGRTGPPPIVLIGVGAVVGFGSALTGSSGPVLLVPIMLLFEVPMLQAVGTSQVVQVVVALVATGGYAFYGGVNFALGTAIGVTATVGVVGGAHIAHRLPALHLRRLAAAVLICAGVFTAVHTLVRLHPDHNRAKPSASRGASTAETRRGARE
jgi:hypothetical protein